VRGASRPKESFLGVAAVAASLAIVAGCGASSSSDATSAVGPKTGILTGTARMYGGPLVERHGRMVSALDGALMSGFRVRVRWSSGGSLTIRTDTRGRFVLRLRQGTYQLDSSCGGTVTVVVRAHSTTRHAISCDYP
jgi:hypothetical protein